METLSGFGDTAFGWLIVSILQAPVNILSAMSNPAAWLDWIFWDNTTEDKQSLMRFVYYGGSVDFIFALLFMVVGLFLVGIFRPNLLWRVVVALEGFANIVGRTFAWAGLIMVLQQIIIVFMQRLFVVTDISFGFGQALTFEISWWAEELKLYNALIVCLCCAYTFVQGGHVRVDLVYSAVSFRAKRALDMMGCLIFMMPTALLIWVYGWFFMWRHLIVPKPSAGDTLERLLAKSRAVRWNVETIGFSPNGFNAYFLFKVLIVAFAAMVFVQMIAFFFRSYLERREGADSENKYLDRDLLGDEIAERAAEIH